MAPTVSSTYTKDEPNRVRVSLPPTLGGDASALLTISEDAVSVTVTLQGRVGSKEVTIGHITARILHSPPPSDAAGLGDRVVPSDPNKKIVVYLHGKPLILLLEKESLKNASSGTEQMELATRITGQAMDEAVQNAEQSTDWVWTPEEQSEEVRRRGLMCETAERTNAVCLCSLRGQYAYVGRAPSLKGRVVFPGYACVGQGGFNTVYRASVYEPGEASAQEGVVRVPHEQVSRWKIADFESVRIALEGIVACLHECLALCKETDVAATKTAAPETQIDPSTKAARLLQCSEEGLKCAQSAMARTNAWIEEKQAPQEAITAYKEIKTCFEESLQKCVEVTGALWKWLETLASLKSPGDAWRLCQAAQRVCKAVKNVREEITLIAEAAEEMCQVIEGQQEQQVLKSLKDKLLLNQALSHIETRIWDVQESLRQVVNEATRETVYQRLEGIPGLVVPQSWSFDVAGRTRTVEVSPLYNRGSLGNATQKIPSPVLPEIARQCVSQVAAMHERGIVHRDLSFENFIAHENTRKEWRVTLIDWDMAALCDKGEPQIEEEQEVRIYGNMGIHCPPEQNTWKTGWITAEQAKQKDAYALGLTLCKLLRLQMIEYNAAVLGKVQEELTAIETVLQTQPPSSPEVQSVALERHRLALTKCVALVLGHPNPIKRLTTGEADAILSGREYYRNVIAGALKRETRADLQRALAPPPAQKPLREE